MITKLISVVKEMGYILKDWRLQKKFDGTFIAQNFKADVDVLAHDFLIKKLKEIKGSIPIISEEDADSLVFNRPDEYWLIDPIDGTLSFVNGYLGFVTQVALMRSSRPVLAAVYAPMLDLLYFAELGCGAFLNEKRLQICSGCDLKVMIDNYPEPKGSASFVFKKIGFSKYLECGSIGLKICKVAQGQANLFFKDVVVRDWDIAPANLIINEAGGFLCDIDGKEFAYRGEYAHSGLIASCCLTHGLYVSDFLRRIKREGIGGSCAS